VVWTWRQVPAAAMQLGIMLERASHEKQPRVSGRSCAARGQRTRVLGVEE
jgi:hypothetical protein